MFNYFTALSLKLPCDVIKLWHKLNCNKPYYYQYPVMWSVLLKCLIFICGNYTLDPLLCKSLTIDSNKKGIHKFIIAMHNASICLQCTYVLCPLWYVHGYPPPGYVFIDLCVVTSYDDSSFTMSLCQWDCWSMPSSLLLSFIDHCPSIGPTTAVQGTCINCHVTTSCTAEGIQP